MTASRADGLNMSAYVLTGDINRKGRCLNATALDECHYSLRICTFLHNRPHQLLGKAPRDSENLLIYKERIWVSMLNPFL